MDRTPARAREARSEADAEWLSRWVEESIYAEKFQPLNRLGPSFRRVECVPLSHVDEVRDAWRAGVLSDADGEQLSTLDFLIRAYRGKDADAPEVFIPFEVSLTLGVNDIRKAAGAADSVRRAGLDAKAFAGGKRVTREAAALAAELGVHLVITHASGDI